MKTLLFALSLVVCAFAQTSNPDNPDAPTVLVNYMNAEACKNLLELHIPGTTECVQYIMVISTTPLADAKKLGITLSFTNKSGQAELRQQAASTFVSAGVVVGTVAFGDVTDVTNIVATVMDDHGNVTVAKWKQP